ncbi:unnamed protein product [Adineta ricciae]|uniref:PKD/REJ-like domain-containing protein n=1 Tax=Adineta ricciae TaxID=249248 RepID=A0A814R7Y8_ADIRI|nr:unnamed protein product [Adineta ricciae]
MLYHLRLRSDNGNMMFIRGDLRSWWIILPIMIGSATAVSYNQPKFCPNVTWNATATTFAGSSIIGTQPSALFVDANNTVYVTSYSNNKIKVWPEGFSSPSKIMSGGLKNSYTMFVTSAGDIIVDNGDTYGRVEKLLPNGTKSTPAMYVSSYCTGLFVDINDTVYCSLAKMHEVIKRSLGSNSNTTTVAGTGLNGSVTLDFPTGIILDTDKNLYIVDYYDSTTLAPTSTQYQTQYTTYNQTIFISSVEQTSTTTTATSTAFRTIISNQSCFSPNVTIIPAAPTLKSPMKIRRSQDFYFISLIEINCNQSFSISTKWTVSNCTSTCFNQVQIDDRVLTTSSELYIPARTLPYGTYLFQLSVIMLDIPQLETTSSVYVDITPSGITANLVQYGTSMITSGYNQDLLFDPGSYSIDMDEPYFNATNWKYKYYCRIYGQYNFPNLQGSLITIDDPSIDPLNPSCLSNRTAWKFANSIHSVIILLSQSLQSNRTYQFMVYMENRKNSSLQATGYLLVKVEHTPRQMIVIGCIIQTMCIPNLEFQLVNPTTQVALFSACSGNCSTIVNITWNVYFGSMNSSSNVTKWTMFNQTDVYENIWFFGMYIICLYNPQYSKCIGRYTGNFTSTSQLFLMNPQVSLWRFEVVYQFPFESSASTLNFVINQPPSNSILFQSSILSQLTQSTNQLTRSSALIASNKCYQLAVRLNAISTQISFEDAQLAADQLTQCVSNVQTAVNGALQERTAVLDVDYSRANDFPADYDTDLDSAWSNPKLFVHGNDFSAETMERNRNLYYQKQVQDQVNQQTKQTLAVLTSALHNHLNIAQNFTINSSSVFMLLQITNTQSLSNQIIKPIASALIQLPSNFTSSESSVSLRSIVQPLAPADQSYSYTNLSTTISLSILDQNGNELSYPASSNNPY